jgi:hypothetical protein
MQVNGELHHIGGTNQVTDNFSKREFILITEQNTNRPQYIKIEFNQAKCNLLDNYQVGDKVSVDFSIKGNLDKNDSTKAYTKLEAWKIELVNK